MDNYDKLKGKDIIIIQYPEGKLNLTEGKIQYLTKATNYEFVHSASTDKGSSGSPIFLKGTTKVVGIHKGFIKSGRKTENCGDFIWPIFCYFKNFQDYNKYSQNNNNRSNNAIKIKSLLSNNNIIFRNKINEINNINKINIKNGSGSNQNNLNTDKLNQMTIIYNIQNYYYSIGLFGDYFVFNNINNCYLLIDGQKKNYVKH